MNNYGTSSYNSGYSRKKKEHESKEKLREFNRDVLISYQQYSSMQKRKAKRKASSLDLDDLAKELDHYQQVRCEPKTGTTTPTGIFSPLDRSPRASVEMLGDELKRSTALRADTDRTPPQVSVENVK